ncbi:venom allergen 5.02-like [Amphibalanus amphitrite]|uniref:venom allergen 5.02-like n=1 Tax=Amphibalanus amphitrite TaxID=1232801 RepID=UPI001C911583|nr:venom allergen 5.02-like [Amphibalanus amphitrite]
MSRVPQTVLVLLLWAAVAAGQRPDYCAFSVNHTMCRYSGPDRQSCGRLLTSGLGADQRRLVVTLHNELRSRVAMGQERAGAPGPQPPAADMIQMVWDDQLAAVAQRWAEQCQRGHDCGSCRADPRFTVGQNMFITIHSAGSGQPQSDWERAIEAWYSEVSDFDRRATDSFPPTSRYIGHYSQMVWARTSHIGCGFVRFRVFNHDNRLYVCNYGPAGNVLLQPVYRRGTACSRCPPGTACSRHYRGLCAPARLLGPAGPANVGPMPGMNEMPGMPGMNEMPGMPGINEIPGMPGMPDMPSMVPGMPGMPSMPGMSEMPSMMPEMPGMVTGMPGIPGMIPGMPGGVNLPGPTLMPNMEVYVVQPDPNSGCFTFRGYIFCGKGREKLVVIRNPFV